MRLQESAREAAIDLASELERGAHVNTGMGMGIDLGSMHVAGYLFEHTGILGRATKCYLSAGDTASANRCSDLQKGKSTYVPCPYEPRPCAKCKGTKEISAARKQRVTCPQCDGTGKDALNWLDTSKRSLFWQVEEIVRTGIQKEIALHATDASNSQSPSSQNAQEELSPALGGPSQSTSSRPTQSKILNSLEDFEIYEPPGFDITGFSYGLTFHELVQQAIAVACPESVESALAASRAYYRSLRRRASSLNEATELSSMRQWEAFFELKRVFQAQKIGPTVIGVDADDLLYLKILLSFGQKGIQDAIKRGDFSSDKAELEIRPFLLHYGFICNVNGIDRVTDQGISLIRSTAQ